jgi:single-strand DNA-binding protein
MASYNRVILVGNLTQDPELKYLPSGTAMCKLKVAVDRGRANQQGERETDFFNVVVWERQAETSAEYLSKGRPVLVEGRLQNRSWEGQDGQKRYATDIRADRVIFLGTRDRQEGGGFSGGDGGARGGGQDGGFGGGQGSEFSGGHGDDFGSVPVEENNLPETDDDIAF